MTLLCKIYRSPRRAETYLYVDAREDFARVPESLRKQFQPEELAMSLVLEPGRKLARADSETVMAAISEQGYYLQMPPPPGEDVETMLDRQWGDAEERDAQ